MLVKIYYVCICTCALFVYERIGNKINDTIVRGKKGMEKLQLRKWKKEL